MGDNGSIDGTREVCEGKGIKPIPIGQRGKGNVIRYLIKEVETPYVIMVNADYTYPMVYANLIYELLKMSRYDVIIGSRSLRDKGTMSILNSTGNFFLSLLASILYWYKINDMCSGMWGFRTEKLKQFALTSKGFTLEADLFSNSIRNKNKIGQIPIGYRFRVGGSRPKLKVWDGFKIAWFLLKRRFT